MRIRRSMVALGLAGVLTLSACDHDEAPQLVEVSGLALTDVETVEEIVEEPFAIRTEVDETLEDGEHKIVRQGERGQVKVTYEITKDENGVEISRKEVKREVVKAPVDAVVKVAKNLAAKGTDGEIIGYSDPVSDYAETKEAPTRTKTDRNVVNQILSHRNQLEKEGDRDRVQSSTSQKPVPSGSSHTQTPASSGSGETSSTTPAPAPSPETTQPSGSTTSDPPGEVAPIDPPAEDETNDGTASSAPTGESSEVSDTGVTESNATETPSSAGGDSGSGDAAEGNGDTSGD